MENLLRVALIDWLRTDPALAEINSIEEESPLSASPPWLGIAASACVDWSTKDRQGREVRIALELTSRADDPAGDAQTTGLIEERIASIPADQGQFTIINAQFLRARARRDSRNMRSNLIEYRFRILANPNGVNA